MKTTFTVDDDAKTITFQGELTPELRQILNDFVTGYFIPDCAEEHRAEGVSIEIEHFDDKVVVSYSHVEMGLDVDFRHLGDDTELFCRDDRADEY